MGQSEYALVVAGGSGNRMESSKPKQFLQIGALPIVMHSLNAFSNYSKKVKLVLVLPNDEMGWWDELCQVHRFKSKVQIIAGGPTRFNSVKNGLMSIGNKGLVAIHDGVRPFVSREIIKAAYQSATQYGSGVAAIELTDSIRQVDDLNSRSVPRDRYRLVQTPQTFQTALIKQAYEKAENNLFPDDASVFESAGNSVKLVEGGFENFKITNQMDLIRARSFMEFNDDQSRSDRKK